jgi:hypothetical protein
MSSCNDEKSVFILFLHCIKMFKITHSRPRHEVGFFIAEKLEFKSLHG